MGGSGALDGAEAASLVADVQKIVNSGPGSALDQDSIVVKPRLQAVLLRIRVVVDTLIAAGKVTGKIHPSP